MSIGIRKCEKVKEKKNVNSKEHYCVLLCSLTNKALFTSRTILPLPNHWSCVRRGMFVHKNKERKKVIQNIKISAKGVLVI
jgi:hypothetical protein